MYLRFKSKQVKSTTSQENPHSAIAPVKAGLKSAASTSPQVYPVIALGLKGFFKENKWTQKSTAEFLFHVSSLNSLTYSLSRGPLYGCCSSALGVRL